MQKVAVMEHWSRVNVFLWSIGMWQKLCGNRTKYLRIRQHGENLLSVPYSYTGYGTIFVQYQGMLLKLTSYLTAMPVVDIFRMLDKHGDKRYLWVSFDKLHTKNST